MRPAFDSLRHATAFLALMGFFLVLPLVLAHTNVSRELAYMTEARYTGAYRFIRQQIFSEKSDIDILFLGSSLLRCAIDAPYVRKQLSETLGRPACVLLFGTSFRGEDVDYAVLKDVVQRRRVKMLVVAMPLDTETDLQIVNAPHFQAYRWAPYGDPDFWNGLDWQNRLAFYAEEVLGAPRRVLSALRPHIEEVPDFAKALGAQKSRKAFEETGEDGARLKKKFKRNHVLPPKIPVADMIFSERTSDNFLFVAANHKQLSNYQLHFLNLTERLTKEYKIPIVVVNLPVWWQRSHNRVVEFECWPRFFAHGSELVGIPPATLFKGMTDEELKMLYFDAHMNANGNRYFTRVITPALIYAYNKYNNKYENNLCANPRPGVH